MGKALLLLVTAVMLAGGMMIYNGTGRSAVAADEQLAQYAAETVAREIAMSAYHLGVKMVKDDDLQSTEGTYQGGTYDLSFDVAGDTVVMVATGTMPVHTFEGSGTTEHVIRATFARSSTEETISEEVPVYFRYGLLSEQSVTINGNVSIDSEDNTVNADVHTNANIQLNGNNSVRGFGSYVGSAHSNPGHRLYSTFDPYVPDGDPTVRQAERVDIPTFDASDYQAMATQTTSGNLTLSGHNTFGTREDPVIWYVSGDLTVTGGTSATGYVIFLVDGNINLEGNFSNTEAYGESNIGLYASGNVNVNGGVEVVGQILAGQNVTMSGNSHLYGSITTAGLVNFNGTVDITFREASPALTTIFEESVESEPGAFVLVSVQERGDWQ